MGTAAPRVVRFWGLCFLPEVEHLNNPPKTKNIQKTIFITYQGPWKMGVRPGRPYRLYHLGDQPPRWIQRLGLSSAQLTSQRPGPD